MKFNCGPTAAERYERWHNARKEWHRWFAWRPVRIGPNECIWLETLDRKGTYHSGYMCHTWWTFEFRRLGRRNDGK
jgi:hypothetical protein